MKKILIGLLICIPLIIVFAIDVSGDIIATSTDIQIEEISLYHDGELLDDVIEIEINDYVNRAYRLEAVTYPAIAVKELIWTSSDMGIATVDANGDVTFTGQAFGEVKIFCSSKNNVTIRATATFYVSGSKLYSIQIVKQGETEYSPSLNMNVGENLQLSKIVLPAPAIREKKTSWVSSNTAVATIDGSGIINAISTGTSTITASVYEPQTGETLTSSVTLTVNAGNKLLKKNNLVIGADSFDVSRFALSNAITLTNVSQNATVNGTTLTYLGSEAGEVALTVQSGEKSEALSVRFTKGALELTFKNLDVLEQTLWSNGAYVNLAAYEFSLEAVVANDDYEGAVPTVNYRIENPSILMRDEDGSLKGVASGTTNIIIEAVGFNSFTLPIEVKTPIEYVALTIDNDEDMRGIEGTRVWGNKFAVKVDALPEGYDLSTVTRPTVDFMYGYVNQYQLKIDTVRPSNADPYFNYYSTNEDYATVDANGLITFKEAAIGNEVGIYLTAKYSYGANAARDGYVFKVMDGINIGHEIDEDDDCVNLEKLNADPTLVNFDLAMMFAYFMEGWYFEYDHPENCVDGKQVQKENLVLQSDIYYHPDHWEPYALTSLYGNGFKLDGRFKVTNNESFLLKMNRSLGGDIIFQNVVLNSAEPPTDAGDWSSLKEKGGYVAGIGHQMWEDQDYHFYGFWEGDTWVDPTWDIDREYDENGKTIVRETNVTFRYCQIQNTFNSIVVKRGNVLVEGCIFRNTVSAAIMYSPQYAILDKFSGKTSLTVRNCIFANSLAPAIMVTPPFITNGEKAYANPDPELLDINIEGQNYIYNWKKIKDIDLALLEEGTLPGGLSQSVNNQINDVFKQVLAREEFDDIKVKNRETGSARNEDYVNLTFCAFGVWYDATKIPMDYNTTEWKTIEADIKSTGSAISVFSKYPMQLLMNYSSEEKFNTMPGENYDTACDENGNPIWMLRLRGEA